MLESKAVRSGDWRGSGVILVVDDDDSLRRVAEAILLTFGFTVLTAGDGDEAVEIFRQHADEIRAVLLDLTMPTLGGEEAFYEMQRIRPDVRVILLSGHAEQEAMSQFSGKGVAGFIQKPFHLESFVQKVQEVLGG